MKEQIPSHLIPVLEEYERQNISKIEEAFSIKQDGMTRAERRAWKRKIIVQKKKACKLNFKTNKKWKSRK